MGMGSKVKTIGGGRAKPVADSFNKFLGDTLNGGDFSSTLSGIFSGGNNPVSPLPAVDMNDPQFAAMSNLFGREDSRNIAELRSRFGAGGGAPRGSAAAFAEGNYRAEAAPRQTLALGEIANQIRENNRADRVVLNSETQFKQTQQMQALAQIFASLQQANSLGTPQAQSVQQPSDFSQIFGAVAGLAPYALAPFTGGASLGLGGLGGGGRGGIPRPPSPSRVMPTISYDNLPTLAYPGG